MDDWVFDLFDSAKANVYVKNPGLKKNPNFRINLYKKKYASISMKSINTMLLHHFVIGKPPRPLCVDHINGNSLDNRLCNLRVCTSSENTKNRGPFKRGRRKGIGLPTNNIY